MKKTLRIIAFGSFLCIALTVFFIGCHKFDENIIPESNLFNYQFDMSFEIENNSDKDVPFEIDEIVMSDSYYDGCVACYCWVNEGEGNPLYYRKANETISANQCKIVSFSAHSETISVNSSFLLVIDGKKYAGFKDDAKLENQKGGGFASVKYEMSGLGYVYWDENGKSEWHGAEIEKSELPKDTLALVSAYYKVTISNDGNVYIELIKLEM